MNRSSLPLLCGLALLFPACARADEAPRPFLSPLFSDHAVLQRERPVPIWGWAKPGEQVRLSLDGAALAPVKVGADGKWMARLPSQKAGVGHSLEVVGEQKNESEVRTNIAFGDVWLCSGQSNMQMTFGWGIQNVDAERKAANYPDIRFLHVPLVAALRPKESLDVKWQPVTSADIDQFSAVAYFFGREIYRKTGVPIGLIDSSWGGTPAQVWASGDALEKLPDFQAELRAVKATRDDVPYADQLAAWNRKYDPGYAGNWSAPAFDDSKWKSDNVPGAFTSDASGDLTQFDGAVWYRKEVVVPPTLANHDAQLSLGAIDDNDDTFWDGAPLGATPGYDKPRSYALTAAKMSAGRHVLCVRVFDTGGPGGFVGKADEMKLSGGGANLSLAGQWRLSRSVSLADTAQNPPPVSLQAGVPTSPGVLFNSMINPLVPYALKGALWYQGEANAGQPDQYKTLLPTLITNWRARFGSGDFPFYIVQLAAFQAPDQNPTPTFSWAGIREAQALASQNVKNSAYSVTTDIGNPNDIHPKNKQEVGRRLALLALARDYGQNVESSGPTVRAMKVEGDAIRLTLDHAEGGLTLDGEQNNVFILAGEDRKWAWAKPTVEGNALVLRAPEVPHPVAVRFAWSNYPRGVVYNGAHLPMAPYRSDAW